MKTPSLGVLAAVALGIAALALMMVGAPHNRPAPAPAPTSTPAPPGVSANGFTLTSAAIELPIDDAMYPAGPNADVINRNCASCHSPSMAMTQPPLTKAQWTATVTKMREAYHAPVPAADVPAIVAYLTAMPGQQGAAGDDAAPEVIKIKSDAGGATG
ncbi:hypothetical protein PX554_24800 [Sphingomonas sp. H39-1-10]|jgi:hypothetical protein|uniref:hypothetical protein n=1 Tax=Sphingomonas pollutisoli TaxID=3030829 RepID=UPI0023BA358F|nr:hypothetical protein [Sphingomonas pollutisoli]MDF0491339.1 hypothetical protein [Sphingomonas pollutisoli]